MSITSRINEMSSHIEQAYDELQGLGADLTNVNKNIENISMVLDDIYDSMPQVSGEGTSLTLEDTRVGKIKSTLKGNTSQTGTPTPTSPIPVNVVSGDNEILIQGKNLFGGYDDIDVTRLGIQTIASNDEITTSGTTNNTGWLFNTGNRPKIYLIAGTYTFSINNFIGTFPTIMSTVLKDEAGNNIFDVKFTTTLTQTFTISTNGSYYFDLYMSTNNASFNSSFNIQIEKGSSSTTYEPYQGNTYNIDLPVENLFDKSTNIISNKGLTTTGGTFDSDTVSIKNFLEVQPNTTYTYSGYDDTSVRKRVCMYSSNSEASFVQESSGTNATLTFTTTSTTKYIRFQFKTSEINNIQLELGSKVNSYTPYGTTPIELCKIGNYKDYFYKDSDKWYLHKEIGERVFNGTESWSYNSSGSYFVIYNPISDIDNKEQYSSQTLVPQLISNYYTPQTWQNFNNGAIGFAMFFANNTLQMRLSSSLTSVDSFKSWLGTNKPIFKYILATPTNIEVEYQPLIDQLNELEKAMSKDGQTNISQVNNDLPFIISASALKKWQESTSLNSTLSMVNPLSLGNTLNTQEIENNTQPIEVDNIEPLEEEENEES